MLRTSAAAFAAVLSLGFAATSADAAALKVYVSGAMAHALEEISQDFAKKNGHTIDFVVGTTGTIQDRVRKGEKADVVEVTNVGLDALIKEKLVVASTRVDLARGLIGVAVPQGAPAIDISTPEAVKQRLLAAKSIAYINPQGGGQAAAAITQMLQKMGIADQVAKKTVYGSTGADSVQKMVAGQADLAISFVSEILPIKGAKLVGELPKELQNPSVYSGAIGAASANPEAARALLAAMQNADAQKIMRNAGLDPITK
jgi:molybdate transport system substrate-binding protein